MDSDNHSLSINEAVFAAILSILIQLACFVVLASVGIQFESTDLSSYSVVVFSTGVTVSILMYRTKSNYSDIFHLSESSAVATTVVLFIPLLLVVLPSCFWYWDIISWIEQFLPEDEAAMQALLRLSEGGVVSYLIVCVMAPIIEEMLFRGVILRGLLHRYSASLAIATSAAIFSIYHLNLYQLFPAFIVGCFIGWVYYLSKSLWPCIVIHVLNNTLALALYNAGSANTFNSILVNVTSVLVSVLGVYMICRIFNVNLKNTLLTRYK